MSGFDRVARPYRWLEYFAFGGALQRARLAHLAALSRCRNILVVGDGDGRCLAALTRHAPAATIHSVDSSAMMLQLARRRVPAAARSRVSFAQADVRAIAPAAGTWDAVVTMFVLDCLSAEDVRQVVAQLYAGLRPGGQWLFADFVVPERGWRRTRARLWIGGLYAFFRWWGGLNVTRLPPSEEILLANGLVVMAAEESQAGMIRSVRFERPTQAY